MNIRTKACLFVALAMVVIALAVVSFTAAGGSERRMQAADAALLRVVHEALSLHSLTAEYQLRPIERVREQWLALHRRIGEDLHRLDPVAADDNGAQEDMRRCHARLGAGFGELAARQPPPGGTNHKGEGEDAFALRLAGQLVTETQALVTSVAMLRDRTMARSQRFQHAQRFVGLACVVALAGALLAVSIWLDRAVVRPITRLHEGTRLLGGGNWDLRVGTRATDEIGALSRSFDQMVADLRQTTASRDELQAEVRERRRAEARLERTLAELKRSNEELEQFAYVASHDLQEPLRKITAFGDLITRDCGDQLSPTAVDYLRRMTNAAGRMQQLIIDLLTYSRVTTRAHPFARVDLGRIAAEVIGDLETRIAEKHARVEVGAMPVIEADPTQMRQLLQNLVGNALKFHRDGIPPVVRVRGETDGAGPAPLCRLTVEDNGIGFDEKHSERIFRIFQRLHGRGTYEGSGIGLAVCRKIAHRHGGAIRVRSRPNEGATFVVELPVTHPAADPAPAAA